MEDYSFSFSKSEWAEISGALEGLLKYGGDRERWIAFAAGERRMLEMICGDFVRLRPRLGRDAPTPKKARAAWMDVARAAAKLDEAIDGLREAGAADFTILDNHQGEAKRWRDQLRKGFNSPNVPFIRPQLPSPQNSPQKCVLEQIAMYAAALEMFVDPVSNKADPMLDGFVQRLARIWESHGGRISHTDDGPFVRFLKAVTASALKSAGEQPMRREALKHCVRRVNVARSA